MGSILALLLFVVLVLVSLVSFGCFVYNIVVAFQKGDTVPGILSICGIIGFILGWINVEKWGHRNVMIAWTISIIVGVILQIASMALIPMFAQ